MKKQNTLLERCKCKLGHNVKKSVDNHSNFRKAGEPGHGSIRQWMLRVPLYFIFGVILLLGTVVLLLQTGPVRDRLRVILIENANERLNATVGIERIGGNLLSDISLEGVSVKTPDGHSLLSVGRVSATYLLPMLLVKVIHLTNVHIDGLRLNMVKFPDGKWNFSTLLKPVDQTEESRGAPLPFRVAVKRFEMADTVLALEEPGKETARGRSFRIDRFVSGVEYGKFVQVSILESSLTIDTPETLSIAVTGKAVFDPETTGFKMEPLVIQSGASVIRVDGNCRFPEKTPVFDCRIGLDGIDVREIGRMLLISGMPESNLSGDISITGTPGALQHRISLRENGAVLDVSGSAGFDHSGFRAKVSGNVRSLDLSKWRMPYTEKLSGVVDADISLTATGFQNLKKAEAVTSVAIRGVSAADIPLDLIRLHADWFHGKVSIDPFEIVSGQDRLTLSGSIEPYERGINLDLAVHLEQPDITLGRLSKGLPQIPDLSGLRGKTDISVAVSGWIDNPRARFSINSGMVSWDRFQAAEATLTGVWQGLPGPETRIDDLRFSARKMGVEQIGTGTLSLTGDWYGWIDNPKTHFTIKAGQITGDRLNIDSLDILGDLQGSPSAVDSRATILLTAGGVRMERLETGTLSLSGSWRGPFSRYAGHAELNGREINIQNNRFKDFSLTADVTPEETVVTVSADHENGSRFEIDGKATPWTTPEKNITINNLHVVTVSPWPESTLANSDPIRFSLTGDKAIKIHACRLEMGDMKIGIDGNLALSGEEDLRLTIDNLELRNLPGEWNAEPRLSGTVSADTSVQGTLERPIVSANIDVKGLEGYGINHKTDLHATVGYKDEAATFRAVLQKQNTPILSGSGNIPIRLSLMPFSLAETAGNMEAALETRKLRFSELPIPRIKNVDWDAVADMNLIISGGLRNPDFSGNIDIHDGHLTLARNKLTYEQVGAKLLLSNNKVTVEELLIAGNRGGRLSASGLITIGDKEQFDTDLAISGDNFYIPYQKAVSARISPRLHLGGGLKNPKLTGEVTITESKINLDRLAETQHSDIQVVDTDSEGGDAPLVVPQESQGRNYLSPLAADILVRVPKNAWLKGQDVNAEIAGEVEIKKRPGGAFLLSGPLHTLRGNFYFMRKNFQLSKGEVEFLGLREINPNLNIEARTRIESTDIIVTLHGPANEMAIDLSSDPVMERSDVISYLLFGRASDGLGGDKAFNVEKAALDYTSGLLAGELRNLLGDVFFIDSFAIDSGNSENGFGSVTLGKYITPEIFVSHKQGLSENDPNYEEITYELTPQLKLETQIGRDNTSSADLTWEFDF